MRKLIYILMAFFLYAQISFAEEPIQKSEPFFNKEEYRKAAEGFKYKTPSPLTKAETNKIKKQNWAWLKYVSYALVIAAIVFLIYKLISYLFTPDNNKFKNFETQTKNEEIEPTIESNLESLLAEALNQNDYREAIRIYYLLSIKNLNDNHILTYTINKTNFEYVAEVGNHPAFLLFRELTLTFESIWFGPAAVNETKLNSYSKKHKELNEIIFLNRKKSISS